MKSSTQEILSNLIVNYPVLKSCQPKIGQAFEIIRVCYDRGGALLICGNGGSASDSDHMVGELMKGFMNKRELSHKVKRKIIDSGGDDKLADALQGSLAAINLSSQTALITAIGNDIGFDYAYAQQVLGYTNSENCLFGVSTSGKSKNVLNAGIVAKAMGMKTIGLTGRDGGQMSSLFDVAICVPESETARIQELHLPIYHTLCAMLEAEFFIELTQ